MSNIYRWIDNMGKNFSQINEQLLSNSDNSNCASDKRKYRIDAVKVKYTNNKSEKYLLHNVVFNSYEVAYYDLGQPVDNQFKKCTLTVYEVDGKNIYYIAEHLSDSRLLRFLLGYNGKKEIELIENEVSSDMLMWLVYKTYNKKVREHIEPFDNIEVTQLIGIKGFTDDQSNKVSATGCDVLKLLSTLAFILESRNYRDANIQLSYGLHKNIEVSVWSSGKIAIDYKKYSGKWGDNATQGIREKLSILICLEIMPLLVKWYNCDKKNGEWSKETQIKFLNQIAENVKNKIEYKINAVSETIHE